MDERYVEEHHVVIRFFANQLSEQEEQSFMRYLRSHPQVVDELAAVGDLRLGLASLRKSGELTTLLEPRPWLRQRTWIALAASVLIAVLALAIGLRSPPQQPMLAATPTLLDARGASLPSAGIYSIIRSRGGTNETDIRLSSRPGSIELRVLPEDSAAASYRVTLTLVPETNGERQLGTLTQLHPGEDGFIAVHVASGILVPARYRLTVEGVTPGGTVESASMFVIRATSQEEGVRR
jgi:hypothetical protein